MYIAVNKVLLIDDDAIQNVMIKGVLEMYGMLVKTERNPLNALGTAVKFGPDMIVCDIVMPGISGSRVARDLQEHPLTRHIPILFLSGIITRREEAASTASCVMMAKPVNMALLVDHIRRLASPPEKAKCHTAFRRRIVPAGLAGNN
jgi:CheY-like chemotaxis protein